METTLSSHYTILVLKILGVYSPVQSKRVIVLSVLYVTLTLFIICMAVIQFPNINDVTELVSNFEAVCGYGQELGKIMAVCAKQKDLTILLEKINQFWKTNVCSDSVKNKLDKISSNSKKFQKLFISCMLLCILMIITIEFTQKKLIVGAWNLRGYETLYSCTLSAQIMMVTIGGIIVGITDCLFLAICIETIIQFKILCHCLEELRLTEMIVDKDQEQYNDKMKLYIQQHNFILAFLNDFKNYYSPVLFVECITIAPIICMDMYVMMNRASMDVTGRVAVTFFTEIIQISFYCILTDSLSKEAMSVGDAIYDSEWYSNKFSTLRKPMTLLIQKSQQPVVFKAGGLFEINSGTVLKVLRMSWSACTVMMQLNNKK